MERFDIAETIRVARLRDGLIVTELFHGPTQAFKDLGLGVAAQLIQYFQKRQNRRCIVIVGTSGDTGGAAVQAFNHLDNVDLVVLFPEGRCSRVQQLQMTTCLAENVHVFAVDGSSDDLDVPIKECLTDLELVKEHTLISVNSINWVRVLVQTAHYFFSYFQVCGALGSRVEFAVPCGAAGNLTAGCVAASMGLPIAMVVCLNSNKALGVALESGSVFRDQCVVPTLASAMDIQVAYNLERLIYLYSLRNFQLVNSVMERLEQTGSSKIPLYVLQNLRKAIVGIHSVSDMEIGAAIYRCWNENFYRVCPHTATAVSYHYERMEATVRVCLATASAAKFSDVLQSVGVPATDDLISKLTSQKERYHVLRGRDTWLKSLREKIIQITAARRSGSHEAQNLR